MRLDVHNGKVVGLRFPSQRNIHVEPDCSKQTRTFLCSNTHAQRRYREITERMKWLIREIPNNDTR